MHSIWALAGLWLLNLTISISNAVGIGKSWVESRHAGGWRRFMAWCVAAMAAVGFTWCISIVLGIAAYLSHLLDDQYVALFFQATYVLLVPLLLSTGYAITVQSWARAYRGGVCAKGVAVYNTFAQVWNTYHAIRGFGPALGQVFKGFGQALRGGGDGKTKMAVIVGFLLLISAGGGIIITYMIIHHYAASGERMKLRTEDAIGPRFLDVEAENCFIKEKETN
jgi:hypothetical protein